MVVVVELVVVKNQVYYNMVGLFLVLLLDMHLAA